MPQNFGSTPYSSEALPANTIPVSAGFVPNTASGNLTAVQLGPASTDSNGYTSAPVAEYTPDGSNVTLGTTTDAAWSGSGAGTAIAILKKLEALLAGTLAANLAQVLGSPMSASNPIITQQQITAAVAAGKVYTATTGAQSTGSQTSALCVFNASTTKTIVIISASTAKGTDTVNLVDQLTLVTTNPSYSNAVTPSNNLGGSSATSSASVTWQASASVTGNAIAHSNSAIATVIELLNNGRVVVLPPGVNSGAIFFVPQGGTGGTYVMDVTYMEF